MATLLVLKGPDEGRRFELTGGVLRLGRDAGCTIRLADTEVSRNHAEIRGIDGHFFVVDLGSSNGTYVNQRRIKHSELLSGDQVRVGQSTLIFRATPILAREAMAERVSMVGQRTPDDASAIIKTISAGEGQRLLRWSDDQADTERLKAALANLSILYDVTQDITHTLDTDELLQQILELIFRRVEADRGCILLRDPQTDTLVPNAVHWRPGIPRDEKITISRTITDYVLKNREGVLTSDAQVDARFAPGQSIMHFGIREAICVPLQGRHELIGLIYIDTRTNPDRLGAAELDSALATPPPGKFREDHLELMIAIGHQAAIAVENTRFYQAKLQAERLAAMGQTIATLSHHIKNILQGIRGGSYMIELGLNQKDEAVVQRGWQIVDKNQRKINNLVMDMLSFSKDREPVLEPSDLNEIVRDILELMQARADEARVRLEADLAADLPVSLMDPEAIHRAVLNIVTNAIDATAERPDARVRVETLCDPPSGVLRVVVTDSGMGIPPDELPQIFNLFSSTKGARGTGLGLPVSQKIVAEHGGQIQVASQVGKGSQFTIELPLRCPPGTGGP